MQIHTVAYILPGNYFIGMMNRADRLRASTTKLGHLLNRSAKCTCGHQKDYHINGREKCVFGICHCQSYSKSES
jgi:hypothetical protein